MFNTIIAVFMSSCAILGLVLVAPSVYYSWRTIPFYYNLARVGLPLLTLAYFLSSLIFGASFPGSNGWISLLFLLGLALIVLAIVVYIYREPGGSQANQPALAEKASRLASDEIVVQKAAPENMAGAGLIFAEAFHHSFDLDFGPDRARNGRLLGELLAIKQGEVVVALSPDSGQVIGAMWLDLGDPSIPALDSRRGWPILRRYLNFLHAAYYAIFALPTVMEKRGSPEQAYIQWLGVHPEWQSRGVGQYLVEYAIESCKKAGCSKLVLHTERSNKRARSLYKRFGFEEKLSWKFSARVKCTKLLK